MTRILYVEDNDDNVFMLKRRLTRAGVDVATNGEEALHVATASVIGARADRIGRAA